jgi:hypothetical protein
MRSTPAKSVTDAPFAGAVDRGAEVVHDDGGAHARELERRRASDAAAGAGHYRRAARE